MSSSPSSTDAPRLHLGAEGAILRLVVPLVNDAGHDRGVDVARYWAERWQLPLLLLTVDASHTDQVDLAVGEHLERTRVRLAAATGIDITEQVLAGPDVVPAIVEQLRDGDLVVMSSAGADGPPTRSHGWGLVQSWRAPTLLVGPLVEPAPPGGAVMVGLDGSPLAEQSLDPAADLAAALGTRLWLVQAVGQAVVDQVEHLRQEGEDASASAYLRQRTDELAATGRDTGWELIQTDDTVAALIGFARDRTVSAIALSTHGRSGLRPEVFGSTCMAVVAGATAPVLVSVPTELDQPALEP